VPDGWGLPFQTASSSRAAVVGNSQLRPGAADGFQRREDLLIPQVVDRAVETPLVADELDQVADEFASDVGALLEFNRTSRPRVWNAGGESEVDAGLTCAASRADRELLHGRDRGGEEISPPVVVTHLLGEHERVSGGGRAGSLSIRRRLRDHGSTPSADCGKESVFTHTIDMNSNWIEDRALVADEAESSDHAETRHLARTGLSGRPHD